MKILFEDKDIAVCVKPYGIVSQSSPDGKDMVSLLSEQLNCEIFPVHRLDRETGGVMVYAKNQKAAAVLSNDISNRKIHKEYIALVHNDYTSEKGELKDLLYRDKNRNKSYVVNRQRKGVKEAILNYTKIKTADSPYGIVSLIKVELVTGRTHQIRVQFSSRGYPLVGDRRYGAKDDARKLGLWSYYFRFNHPITGEQLEFSAQPDRDSVFENII
ncbi:MAG: RluA family pseudouridine synthase [Clostridia bacterium]|nr:RluA family pseudouridine synthase [Clostridia bacterium]